MVTEEFLRSILILEIKASVAKEEKTFYELPKSIEDAEKKVEHLTEEETRLNKNIVDLKSYFQILSKNDGFESFDSSYI